MSDDLIVILGSILFIIGTVGAYIRHLAWTITLLLSDGNIAVQKLVLAGLGVVFPPVGMIHGWMLWLGY